MSSCKILGPQPRIGLVAPPVILPHSPRHQTQYSRCQQFGHIAPQCSTKTYPITEPEVRNQEAEYVEEVYEPNIEDYEEDFEDEPIELDFVQNDFPRKLLI